MRLVFVLDCASPSELARFWTEALGYEAHGGAEPYVVLVPGRDRPSWPEIVLQRVKEPKTVKNRMHVDLRVDDLTGEIGRLEGARSKANHGGADRGGRLRLGRHGRPGRKRVLRLRGAPRGPC